MADLDDITNVSIDCAQKPLDENRWAILVSLSPDVLRPISEAEVLRYTDFVERARFQINEGEPILGYKRTKTADTVIANAVYRVYVEQKVISRAIRKLADEINDQSTADMLRALADSLATEINQFTG